MNETDRRMIMMNILIILALSAVCLFVTGCGDIAYDYSEKINTCHNSNDCNYPCEYCDSGLCKANPEMVNDPQCPERQKPCSTTRDCCYPCEYCEGGLCKVNEGIEKETECLYAKRWTCQYR
jgi:hypothetical protein